MDIHVVPHQFQGWRPNGSLATVHSLMTVYEGAVRIQGKDGTDLRPWRVVVYQRGEVLRYTTVPAPTGAEAARRAQERWPNGTVVAF